MALTLSKPVFPLSQQKIIPLSQYPQNNVSNGNPWNLPNQHKMFQKSNKSTTTISVIYANSIFFLNAFIVV